LIRDLYQDNTRVDVCSYSELTGLLCRRLGIRTLLRGLRNTVDFEYERNIMQVNRTLFPEIQTVLLFTPADYVAISSSVIRELLAFGGDPTPLMPKNIDIRNYR
ncbi:MAG: pantetheine-phosphate adenylyltransferase, partial [Alistipes sp.]|nr:pantetheine-phosphate adenylyltransferase [Alistipes sp.]